MTEQKKTDAWMPLWIGDYLADTMSLTTEQHGAYLLLLFAYWRNRGPLPDDDSELRSTTKSCLEHWSSTRQKMLKFFTVENGHWHHARADKELLLASTRAQKAAAKAKKAAEARWGSKETGSDGAPSNAPSNAPSIPQALHKECPSPSPSPSSLSSNEEKERESAPAPTPAGSICKAMRGQGIAQVNPAHPGLLALIDAGATIETFENAAAQAVDAEKASFAYVLGIVKGQMADAATLRSTPLVKKPPQTGETAYARAKREQAEVLVYGAVKNRSEARKSDVIEMEVPRVA
jgi:uncharacterized protein YdaU (DUF1376 family)